MEDSKAGESDSDFASAESDQNQEELNISTNNSPSKTDDVTEPMMSRDKEEVNAMQAADHDSNEEIAGNNDTLLQPEQQENKSQVNETIQTEKTDLQSTSPHSAVTSNEQATSDVTSEQAEITDSATPSSSKNITSSSSKNTTSSSSSTIPVAHDVGGKELTKEEQNKVCL